MALLEALLERAGADVLTMGAAVSAWREVDDGVEISLTNRKSGDTSTASGTVLIAADGINSALRAGFYPDEGPAVWGGTMMWRGITKGPKFLTGRSMAMAGNKECKFVCYPIGDTEEGGSLINWIADLTLPKDYDWLSQDWNRKGDRADFADRFKDMAFDWLDIPKLIAEADGIGSSRWWTAIRCQNGALGQ